MYDTQKVRKLNDAFRTSLKGGRLMLTRGILNREDANDIVRRVQRFEAFTTENDPNREHDFGAFEAGRDLVFWKIDYYSRDLSAGSEDPSNTAVTTRVLTIMLGEEY
jgi:Protein of unknown function (DUF3768)